MPVLQGRKYCEFLVLQVGKIRSCIIFYVVMKRLEVAHLQAAPKLKDTPCMKHQKLLGCSFSKNERSGISLVPSRKYQEFLILPVGKIRRC
jgi:hypothetical protein